MSAMHDQGIGQSVRRRKWKAGVVKRMHKGALTRVAKAAGMSDEAYARAHYHSKGTAGERSRLYFNLTGKEAPE